MKACLLMMRLLTLMKNKVCREVGLLQRGCLFSVDSLVEEPGDEGVS